MNFQIPRLTFDFLLNTFLLLTCALPAIGAIFFGLMFLILPILAFFHLL